MKPFLNAHQITNLVFLGLAIPTGFALWHTAESIANFSSTSRSVMEVHGFTSKAKDTAAAQVLHKARRKMITTVGALPKDARAEAVK